MGPPALPCLLGWVLISFTKFILGVVSCCVFEGFLGGLFGVFLFLFCLFRFPKFLVFFGVFLSSFSYLILSYLIQPSLIFLVDPTHYTQTIYKHRTRTNLWPKIAHLRILPSKPLVTHKKIEIAFDLIQYYNKSNTILYV